MDFFQVILPKMFIVIMIAEIVAIYCNRIVFSTESTKVIYVSCSNSLYHAIKFDFHKIFYKVNV